MMRTCFCAHFDALRECAEMVAAAAAAASSFEPVPREQRGLEGDDILLIAIGTGAVVAPGRQRRSAMKMTVDTQDRVLEPDELEQVSAGGAAGFLFSLAVASGYGGPVAGLILLAPSTAHGDSFDI